MPIHMLCGASHIAAVTRRCHLPAWLSTRVTRLLTLLSLLLLGMAALRDRRKTVKIREVSTGNTVERMVFPNVVE